MEQETALLALSVLYNMFAAIPGVKVVVPSNPYDAKGLLMSAIQGTILLSFQKIKHY